MAAENRDVVVIGAGHAGLAVSHELSVAGVDHVILERAAAVASAWAGRWDSFTLVLPNHTIQLPGRLYGGDDPHGFLARDDVVALLREYADSFAAPVRTGVEVTSLRPRPDTRLELRTAAGDSMVARAVVVATGAYQRLRRPAWVADVPDAVRVLEVGEYRNPGALPEGTILVVGSGQSGCQVAEDLVLAGRSVVLACGRSTWSPRRVGGQDFVDWLILVGFMDTKSDQLPDPRMRLFGGGQMTGRDGGHDLTTRTLRAAGVRLGGHLTGVEHGGARFAGDLRESVAWGDQRYAMLCGLIERRCGELGVTPPALPGPEPFVADELESLDLGEVGAIVLTTGFRPAYASWIEPADAFDEMGLPLQTDGASSVVPGLFFSGTPFLRSQSSALLRGAPDDAPVVAAGVLRHLAS
ncbi:flavin-containing monooxygenase [Granulicoccus phenolivorans]|uniref:flavin-containing monooxygenase n=1 Tax=Granulicoccus phenolivorans TaxID=266854 RepID=UPI0004177A9E|nr:NAD(P)/FAD-dependent oxidoreductase [Granulicoccus phenolivorans]